MQWMGGLGWATSRTGRLAWGPAHLTTPHDVDVDVVDRLAPVGPLVHHQPVALAEALLFGTVFGHDHQMTQELKQEKGGIQREQQAGKERDRASWKTEDIHH